MLFSPAVLGELVGSYRLVEKLGQGGMGVVWRGEHVTLGRKAAIKMIRPELSDDAELTRRFFNEARSAAQLDHPGVVAVQDYGTHSDGSAYIVMELLAGEPLSARLKRQGRLGVAETVGIGRQIAATLAVVHDAGTVHRDLKPDNVFLVPDRDLPLGVRVKLLDFGIAKLRDDAGGARTRAGAILGTPAYMAPEQCRGARDVDARADVYALGCILFEMACGQPPFHAEGFLAMLDAHAREPPPPARAFAPSLPPELEALILRMMAKLPGERPRSMREVDAALAELVRGDPRAEAFAPTLAAGPVSVPAARRSALPLWLALIAVVAIAGAVVAVSLSGRPSAPIAYAGGGVRFLYAAPMTFETRASPGVVIMTGETPSAVMAMIQSYSIEVEPARVRDRLIEGIRDGFIARQLPFHQLDDRPVTRAFAGAERQGRRLDYEVAGHTQHIDVYAFAAGGRVVAILFQSDAEDDHESGPLFTLIAGSLGVDARDAAP